MPLNPGTKLGPYEILSPLGQGGMGEVYRARDTRLAREVAVKVLPEHLSASSEARQRFEREARSASSLNHPHICTIHDIGSDGDTGFLVMELLEGETLAARLERGALSTSEMLDIAIPLADALDRAHRSGLVHRDLKPGNVMLTPQGPKLLDFGLAKGLEATAPTDLTATPTMTSPLTAVGHIVGTFQYMAPEQLEGSEADFRSDLWAFGTMLYEMTTGRRAFQGQTQAGLIASILKEDPPPVPEVVPDAPPALQHLIGRCLAKDPDDRWQTATDVAAELKWIRSGGGAAVVLPASGETPTAGRARVPARVWGAAALLGAALFAAGWFSKLQPAAPPSPVIRASLLLKAGTTLDPDNTSLALSPDGTRLAYVGVVGTSDGLWVRRLDSLQAQHLAGTEGASYPFWSPDGRHLGFFAGRKLRRVPADGGTVQTICDAPDGRGASWGADGVIVFAPDALGGLERVSSAGGTPVPLTTAGSGLTHRNPRFLPDGRRLFYFASGIDSESDSSIRSLDVVSGDSREILKARSEGIFVEPNYLAFVRDGNLMAQRIDPASLELRGEAVPVAENVVFNGFRWTGAYAFSRNGLLIYRTGTFNADSQLTWFDLDGNSLGTVGRPQRFWLTLRISPDGTRALAGIRREETSSGLWLYDLEKGIGSRFTFDDQSLAGVFSPDSRRVVYSRAADGVRHQMVFAAVDGRASEEVRSIENIILVVDWHPGGDRLLTWNPSSGFEVRPVSGPGAEPLDVPVSASDLVTRFSPDGRWILFGSSASGQPEIFVAPYPDSGARWQISDGARGTSAAWLSDGSGILYADREGNLKRVPIRVSGVSLQAGPAETLFGGRFAEIGASLWAVSPDGKKILAAVPLDTEQAPELILVTNWAAALEASR